MRGVKINDKNLINDINLALPNPVLEVTQDSDVVDGITGILGKPRIVDLENALTEIIFEAEDSHNLILLRDIKGVIIGFSVLKQQQVLPKCPKGWMNNIPLVFAVSTPFSYIGFKFLSFGSLRAYTKSRDDASSKLAKNVTAALLTLCPGTCPPNCTCIPKKWTAEVINSTHTVRRWRGIRIGGIWTARASQSIRAYCK